MSDDPVLAALHRLEQGQKALELGQNGLEQRLKTLEGGQKALEQGQKTLEKGQDALRGELIQTRADLMSRLDRLQDAFTEEKEGRVVNFGAGERAERIAKAASDETRLLGEQVTALTRLVHRLQSSLDALRGFQ